MDGETFWHLIEDARARAAAVTPVPTAPAVGRTLAQSLRVLAAPDILQFHAQAERTAAAAFSWETCAAAYVIWGRISDSGLEDFVGGLLALGRRDFTTVVADPDALAAVPLVRSIARGDTDRFAMAGESVMSAAGVAYGVVSGDEDAFWDALEAVPDAATAPPRWTGPFGTAQDAAEIPRRLPRLSSLFGRPLTVD